MYYILHKTSVRSRTDCTSSSVGFGSVGGRGGGYNQLVLRDVGIEWVMGAHFGIRTAHVEHLHVEVRGEVPQLRF